MHPDFIVVRIRLLMLLCRKHTGKSDLNIGPMVLFFKDLNDKYAYVTKRKKNHHRIVNSIFN